jgi:hypothetical protein
VPVPTADELYDAAAIVAEEGVQSATVDGRSATAMDPLKQIEVADRIQSRELIAGTNTNGGPKTGWGFLRPAKVIPPGAC